MKEGTGGDPFGDDDPLDGDSSGESGDADSGGTDGDERPVAATSVSRETEDDWTERDSDDSTDNSRGDDGLPWAVERNSVKSDREMVQFYLRDFVQDRESEFQREIETETGYDTYLTDVREAAYLVAMNHPEEVAELLDEWGCEYV
ncbi:hypothetical protein M0R89_20210 (plasmid) [Halorussus limi]|uniref:Uncharacterized protein n=1 Tax=Halorussus limi TaxID=2938695 RepID=A0A8U0I0A1_9EURY|nr:hypothetical protein [Halorussus limi]UPV76795.1 hypothetical protein M0R89_20210 [Halorussus limi]